MLSTYIYCLCHVCILLYVHIILILYSMYVLDVIYCMYSTTCAECMLGVCVCVTDHNIMYVHTEYTQPYTFVLNIIYNTLSNVLQYSNFYMYSPQCL